MDAHILTEDTYLKHNEGDVCIVMGREEAEILMDLCAYIEDRGVGVTDKMIGLAQDLGPEIEMALGYNEGNGDE